MKISITGVDAAIRGLNGDLKRIVEAVAQEVYTQAKRATPVKTGNARRNWNKQVTQKGATVDNKVPYIERLEAGASKQAPRGIIGPTLSQVKGKFK